MGGERLKNLANDLIVYILNHAGDVAELSHYLHGIGYTDKELEEFEMADD